MQATKCSNCTIISLDDYSYTVFGWALAILAILVFVFIVATIADRIPSKWVAGGCTALIIGGAAWITINLITDYEFVVNTRRQQMVAALEELGYSEVKLSNNGDSFTALVGSGKLAELGDDSYVVVPDDTTP